ncbi:hypothetical protein JB92DRAFT_3011826 [Gautieria morchelliformis]|nr:hypothetical protein JB92DRAFT_3011826 [Gautieria morchelliformis]
MQVTSISLLLAAMARQTFGVLFITNPTGSTTAQGGQSLTINWMDNMTAPSLATIGPCEVGLYAGNMQQQTELQVIAPSVDVSKQTSQDFIVNSTLGPNSNAYFIRFTSLSFKDPNNPQFPYEAFSAKFSLSGMSGQFSPSVQAQISGVTSGSVAVSTPAAASTLANAAQVSTTTVPTTAKSATASSSSAPKSTQSANGALSTRGNGDIISAIGVVAVLIRLTL